MQKTTENIHVLDGLRRNVTFLLLRLINTLTYLLTYLLTYTTDAISRTASSLQAYRTVLLICGRTVSLHPSL